MQSKTGIQMSSYLKTVCTSLEKNNYTLKIPINLSMTFSFYKFPRNSQSLPIRNNL